MNNQELKKSIIKLLTKSSAHTSFYDVLSDIPLEIVGMYPPNLPYSIWDLVEHIRIAQRDILEFSRDRNHQSPEWPNGYWVEKNHQPSYSEWENALAELQKDRAAFIKLIEDAEDLTKTIEWGQGQHLLQEALTLADHDAYHLGEILVLRRLLGNWK